MPRHAREVYVRRRVAVALGGLLGLGAIGLGIYSGVALGAPLPEASVTVATPETAPGAEVGLEPARFGASGIAAVGWDAPFYAPVDDTPRPIASITKVVAALMAFDRLPFEGDGPTIVLSAQDAAYYRASIADAESRQPAVAGVTVSERDVLEAMLVASASNFARTMADWAFGSQEAFAAAAPEWLAAHGLTGTTIVEPTGADPRNASTVRDLLRIAELALANPVIAGIVGQSSADLPGVGAIGSTNALLGVDGIDGIKTGTLAEAGACLLFSAEAMIGTHSVTLVGVVLGGPDHPTVNASVQALLASAVGGFREELVPAGSDFGDYETAWGATADPVSSTLASFLLWGTESIAFDVSLEPVVTAKARTEVGTAVVSSPRETIEVPLVLDAALPDPGAEWRWTHPGR